MLRNVLSALMVFAATAAMAAEDFTPRIALVNVQAVSSEQAEMLRGYMEKNLRVPVRLVEAKQDKTKTIIDQAHALVPLMTPEDASFIALLPAGDWVKTLTAPENKFAVINTDYINADDKAVFERRLKTMSIRTAGHLFGVGLSPDPHSCMHPYRTLEELDKMGTNFDPPSGQTFQMQSIMRGMRPVRPNFDKPAKAPAPAKK